MRTRIHGLGTRDEQRQLANGPPLELRSREVEHPLCLVGALLRDVARRGDDGRPLERSEEDGEVERDVPLLLGP